MLKKGDKFDAEVLDLTSTGQGVLKHESGLTCFASGVWLGEKASFQVVDLKRNYAQLKVIELTQASKYRREPLCKYAPNFKQRNLQKSCGGCPWMFVYYDAQLEAKQRRIQRELKRRLPTYESALKAILPSETEFNYRNRVQFKSDGKQIGFLNARSHTLIDIENCHVIDPSLSLSLNDLRSQLPNPKWQPHSSYSRNKRKWVTIDVDYKTANDNNDCEERISINKRLPFKQANDDQNEKMKSWLHQKLNIILSKFEPSIDKSIKITELFCGAGNFTQILQSFANVQIVAAECEEKAIDQLNSRKWDNVDAQVVDLFDENEFEALLKTSKAMDILVLDPPREGLKVCTSLFLKENAPKHIIYISCDVATFFRDAQLFITQGFHLNELQPIDLFPQTPHVELLAEFSL